MSATSRSSGWSTGWRTSWGSIGLTSGAETSCRLRRCHTRPGTARRAAPPSSAAAEARRKLRDLSGGRLDVAPEDIAELIPDGLDASAVYDPQRRRAYAAGSAALVVDVDVETGAVDVVRHVFVHDVGRPINPTVVEGQVHGGAAHGMGYALFDEIGYDD